MSEVTDSSLPSPFPATAKGINFEELASDQRSCPEVLRLQSSPSLRLVSVPVKNGFLLCDARTQVLRPFSALHSLSHPGTRASRRLISSRFVWCGLANDMRNWCRACISCQRGKVLRHVQLRPEKILVPFRRFSHIHVDLVGPLPPSQGFTYLLTCVDRSTRWPEAFPLQGISAAEFASTLFHGWIARFGVPAIITSDRGAQFTSSLWSAVCSLLGIVHRKTTAFHPQANGMVERFHRQLKNSLRARLAAADWYNHLPWVLLGLRSARERIQPHLLRRLFMVQIWSSLISSYRVRILRQTSSTRILKTRCRVFVQFLLVTILPKFQSFLSRFQYL